MHRINLVYLLTMLHLRSIKLERTIPQTFHCHDIGGKWSYRQRMPPHFIFSSRKSRIHAGTAPNCTFSAALKQLVLKEMFSTVVLKSEIFLWRSRCLQCKSNVAFLFSILLLFLPTYKMSPYWKNGNTTVEWWWKQVACSSGCGAVCCSPCMYMTFSATGNEIKKQSLVLMCITV